MDKRLLLVFHDAGGAAAAAPLIPKLKEEYVCRILAYKTAGKELGAYDFEPFDHITENSAKKIINEFRPHLIFTGTSAEGDTIDRALIKAAKSQNIPTLSILDYWLNYKMRFADENGQNLKALPDKIAVMNNDAKIEMISEGIPLETIEITGSPRFDALKQDHTEQKENRMQIAQSYGISPDKHWVLFLSQPFADYFKGEERSRQEIGYTEKDAINCLTKALKGKDVQILARLHPREPSENKELFNNIQTVFLQDIAIDKLISAVDLIAGMSTVALIDAYLMKKNTISIQPNPKGKDLCYLSRHNLIPICKTSSEVEHYLNKVINNENIIDLHSDIFLQKNACSNILRLIKDMMVQ